MASPVTLSQVEDILATSKMIQALHSQPPSLTLSPMPTPQTLAQALPVSESRLMPPQLWYAKNPPPVELEGFLAWVLATLANGVPVERLKIIVDSSKAN
jgi:hypothetical protein